MRPASKGMLANGKGARRAKVSEAILIPVQALVVVTSMSTAMVIELLIVERRVSTSKFTTSKVEERPPREAS
jgi:hypothetical protein